MVVHIDGLGVSTRGLDLSAFVVSGMGVAILVWHPDFVLPWYFVATGVGIGARRWFPRNYLYIASAMLFSFGMGTGCTAAYLEPLPPEAARHAGVRVPGPDEIAQFHAWEDGGKAVVWAAGGLAMGGKMGRARSRKERATA